MNIYKGCGSYPHYLTPFYYFTETQLCEWSLEYTCEKDPIGLKCLKPNCYCYPYFFDPNLVYFQYSFSSTKEYKAPLVIPPCVLAP